MLQNKPHGQGIKVDDFPEEKLKDVLTKISQRQKDSNTQAQASESGAVAEDAEDSSTHKLGDDVKELGDDVKELGDQLQKLCRDKVQNHNRCTLIMLVGW